MGFVGAGTPYVDDELIFTVLVDVPSKNESERTRLEQVVKQVPCIMSCVVRADYRNKELTVTMPARFSDAQLRALRAELVLKLTQHGYFSCRPEVIAQIRA
jgi:hypothetical protein